MYNMNFPDYSKYIELKMKQYKITGCSIALVDGNETVWSQGFGYADSEKGIRSTSETQYLIGSTTKVFTGTAVMQLSQQGKVDIDKPVQTYLPELSYKTRFPEAPPVTVRSLMTHHSGLPGDNFERFYNMDPNDRTNTFRSAVTYLNGHNACYPPNYVWSYSNLGTDLLGMVVERASGTDYDSYLKENIFRPLKMANSSTVADEGARAGMARPYDKYLPGEEHFLRDVPAGCIISNVNDMARFIKMVIAGGKSENTEFLKGSILDEMITPQNQGVALDNGFKMGLNWMLDWPFFDYAGRVCWHDGSSIHYNSLVVVLPEQQLGVVLMSNSSTALPVFLREAAEKLLVSFIELKSGIRPPEFEKNIPVSINSEDLANYTGKFASIMGLANIYKRNDRLKLNMFGMNFGMIPNRDGWFSLEYKLLGFIPLNLKILGSIRVNVLKVNNERYFALEQRVSNHQFRQNTGREFTHKNVPENWRLRVGKYEAAEKDNRFISSLRLSYRKGILFAEARARKLGKLCAALDCISDKEAVMTGLGRFAGDTVTAFNSGRGEELELLGLKFIKS